MNASTSMRSACEVNSSSGRSRSAMSPFAEPTRGAAPVADAAEISEAVYTDGVRMASRSLDALHAAARRMG